MREDKPEIYLQVVSKLIPKDIKIEVPQLQRIAHVIVDVMDKGNKETIDLPGPIQDTDDQGGVPMKQNNDA